MLDVDQGSVENLSEASDALRYADFGVHPLLADGNERHAWVLAVEEDHTHPEPSESGTMLLRSTLVRKRSGGSWKVQISIPAQDLAQMAPEFRGWSGIHPNLPFKGVKVFYADWTPEGTAANITHVAGTGDTPSRSYAGA